MPASRYGRTTSECAEVAWRAARVVGDLDYAMHLTVNDHDDIENLLFWEEVHDR